MGRTFSRFLAFLRRQKGDGRAPLEQVGVIPFARTADGIAVLLITSRRTGRWLFPKGGLMDGLAPWEAAAQEALEEAGVEGIISTAPFASHASWKETDGGVRPANIALYAMEVTGQHDKWAEAGERQRHWATLEEAERLLSERGLYLHAAALAANVARAP